MNGSFVQQWMEQQGTLQSSPQLFYGEMGFNPSRCQQHYGAIKGNPAETSMYILKKWQQCYSCAI